MSFVGSMKRGCRTHLWCSKPATWVQWMKKPQMIKHIFQWWFQEWQNTYMGVFDDCSVMQSNLNFSLHKTSGWKWEGNEGEKGKNWLTFWAYKFHHMLEFQKYHNQLFSSCAYLNVTYFKDVIGLSFCFFFNLVAFSIYAKANFKSLASWSTSDTKKFSISNFHTTLQWAARGYQLDKACTVMIRCSLLCL